MSLRAALAISALLCAGAAAAQTADPDPLLLDAPGPGEVDDLTEHLPADGEVRSLFRLAPPPPEGQEAAPTSWSDPIFVRPESRTVPADVATLRMLDKMSGDVQSFDVPVGARVTRGRLEITLSACRVQPPDLPADAWAYLEIRDKRAEAPSFEGWMIASTPALSALDHQRYDVWVLSCSTSSTEASSASAKKSD
jgi:hypothetical protein